MFSLDGKRQHANAHLPLGVWQGVAADLVEALGQVLRLLLRRLHLALHLLVPAPRYCLSKQRGGIRTTATMMMMMMTMMMMMS